MALYTCSNSDGLFTGITAAIHTTVSCAGVVIGVIVLEALFHSFSPWLCCLIYAGRTKVTGFFTKMVIPVNTALCEIQKNNQNK